MFHTNIINLSTYRYKLKSKIFNNLTKLTEMEVPKLLLLHVQVESWKIIPEIERIQAEKYPR